MTTTFSQAWPAIPTDPRGGPILLIYLDSLGAYVTTGQGTPWGSRGWRPAQVCRE
jgi:hypothetical protein